MTETKTDEQLFKEWVTENFNMHPSLIDVLKSEFIHKLNQTEKAWNRACCLKNKTISEKDAEIERLKELYSQSLDANEECVELTKNLESKLKLAVEALEKIYHEHATYSKLGYEYQQKQAKEALAKIRGEK